MRNLGASVLFTAIYTLAFPLSADAARLGKLTVRSAIGEPFNAEIGLAATPEELSTLTVRLAPSTDYMEQGIDYPASLSSVHIDLVKRTDNTAYILINSPLPHGSPFLELLVQAEWATGMTMRPYTTIENTPVFSQQKSPADTTSTNIATAPVASSSQPALKEAAPQTQDMPQQPSNIPPPSANEPVALKDPLASTAQDSSSHKNEDLQTTSPAQGNPETAFQDNSQFVTKPGDTLFNIALKSNPGGLTTDQVLKGIFAANKHAFIKNDINKLKAGQKIRIPSKDELLAIDATESQAKIKLKSDDWGKFSMKLAEQAQESESTEDDIQKNRDAKGQLSVDVAADHREIVGDHHIVKVTSDISKKSGNGSIDKASQVAAMKDDAVATENQEKQLEEAKRQLEKQIQDAQKLLDLKNNLLAQKNSPNVQASTMPGKNSPQKDKDSAIFTAGSILTLVGFIWLLLRGRRNRLPIQ